MVIAFALPVTRPELHKTHISDKALAAKSLGESLMGVLRSTVASFGPLGKVGSLESALLCQSGLRHL
jgi:hypothetical protein